MIKWTSKEIIGQLIGLLVIAVTRLSISAVTTVQKDTLAVALILITPTKKNGLRSHCVPSFFAVSATEYVAASIVMTHIIRIVPARPKCTHIAKAQRHKTRLSIYSVRT